MATKSAGIKRVLVTFLSISLLLSAQVFANAPQAKADAPISTATVTGKVIDSVTSQPLAAVTISDDAATSPATTTTDSSGDYSLTVPIGDHVLSVKLSGYVTKNSALFTAAANDSLTMNFSLDKYATASGVVVADGTTTGIGSVVVKFFDATTTDLNPVITTTTASDGSWSLTALVPGTYKVQFDGSATDYMSRWFDAKATRDEAGQVVVAPGAVITASGALVKAAKVSGKVTDAQGNPIQDASVTVHGSANVDGYAVTDSTGSYEVRGLAADQYTVEVRKTGYVTTWLGDVEAESLSTSISVPAAAAVTGANIVMNVGGSISGTVLPLEADQAMWGSYVYAFTVGQSWPYYTGYVSKTDGTYTVGDLPPGSYHVEFSCPGYDIQYYDNSPTESGAKVVQVTRGATTSGIDGVVTKTGAVGSAVLTGQVVDADGTPISGVTVTNSGSYTATTAADGTYTVTGYSGYNSLGFSKAGYLDANQSLYASADNTASNPYPVSTVSLVKATTLSGRITGGANNLPVAYASVSARAPNGNWGGWTTTASDGTYTLSGVAEGIYTIEVESPSGAGFATEYYGGATVQALATYVAAGGETVHSGLDVRLGKAGSVSGSVARGDGSLAVGASVTMVAFGFSRTITTDGNGAFTFGGIPEGSFQISATAGGVTTWWPGARTRAEAAPIEVSGDDVSGVRLVMAAGYSLTGTVRDAQGQQQAGTTVYLLGADGQQLSTTTNASGGYAFLGLAAGPYKLGVVSNYQTIWLPGSYSSALAGAFDVTTDVAKDVTVPVKQAVTLHVKGADGTVVGDGDVTVYDAQDNSIASASLTGGTGQLELLAGVYSVVTQPYGFGSTTTSLNVAGATEATVTVPMGGKITGTLTGATNFFVMARNVVTGDEYPMEDAQSAYTISGLPTGTYVLSAAPYDGHGGFCGDAAWFGGTDYRDAARIHVVDGAATTGVDLSFTCAPSGPTFSIAGSVTLPTGVVLTSSNYYYLDITLARASDGVLVDSTNPVVDGSFSFAQISPGDYLLTASGPYLGLGEVAVQVTVTDTDVHGVTVALPSAGSITGRVVNAFGHSLSGATVVATAASGSTFSGTTGANGAFSVLGLSTGDYSLQVQPPAPYNQVTINPVHVVTGQATAVPTVALQLGGRIAGMIPQGFSGVEISTVDAVGKVTASTYAYGSDYTLWGVPAGTAYVKFSGYGIVTEWWKDAAVQGAATPITVVANQAVGGISPTLTLIGSLPKTTVAGTVTGPDGAVANAEVYAVTAAGSWMDYTVTDADGHYTLTVDTNTSYTVSFDVCFGIMVWEIGCLSGSYGDSRVIAVETTPVTGVDFAIAPSTFVTSPAPTITGTPVSGQTLTASTGAWDPTPTTLTLQWYADGTVIPGATAATLALTDAQVGKVITVEATGKKAGYDAKTVASSPTAAVTKPPVTAGTVSITGSPIEGGTLTAVPGTWAPDGVQLSYQWRRDGEALAGSTGLTYTPVGADVGHTLAVAVTGAKSGYESVTVVSAATAPVVAQPVITAGAVTVSGTPAVGSVLTAVPGTWTPSDATLSYQWRRDGAPISNATQPTYTPILADVTHDITVAITGAKDGYVSATAVSAQTVPVPKPSVTAATVSIAGAAIVGSTLTASTGSWVPDGVTLAYVWRRDGVDIDGATGTTYVPVAGDVGATLTVAATGSLSGYTQATAVSTATAAVQPKSAIVPGTPTISGAPLIGLTVIASAGTWTPGSVTLSYQWRRDGAAIDGATTSRYALAEADAGHDLSVAVTGSADGYDPVTVVSAPVRAHLQPVTAGTVTISGTAAVASTLTAVPSGWGPAGVTLTYEWRRDGAAIGGATSSTYNPVVADVAHTLTVAVTGAKGGYESATVVSAATGTIAKPAVSSGTVTISGTPLAGLPQTAIPGSWLPADVTLTYQWRLDGAPIVGATSATYTPSQSDVGHLLSVAVTGTKDGYDSATAVSSSATVAKPVVVAGTVTITGSAVVASTLTASAGAWAPADVALAFQWRRDGTNVDGATASAYVPVVDDIGHALTVAVTGTKDGYVSASVVSAPTAAIEPKDAVVAGTPTISGTPVVGAPLKANAGTWTPGDATLSYQWRRDGNPIAGATTSSYRPIPGDEGHSVTVAVTGSKVAYKTATAVSGGVVIQSATSKLGYEAFVKASYMDFLGRMPSDAEVAAQTTALAKGGAATTNYLTSLAHSEEWLSAIVTKMYQDTLGRSPDAAGLATWVSWLRSGRFTVAQAAALMYSSDEYYLYHAGGTSTTWVSALYTKLLSRDADTAGLTYWVKLTNDPKYGRDRVAMDLYQSTESRMHRVANLYQALLKRDPDPTGWPFWTQQVYTTGDISLAVILAQSAEYWLLSHDRF